MRRLIWWLVDSVAWMVSASNYPEANPPARADQMVLPGIGTPHEWK